MENLSQEIEFLDLNGLSEQEKSSLSNFLSPVSQTSSWEENSQELLEDVLPNVPEEIPRQVIQDVNPCPTFPLNVGIQGMYPANICVPQYRPINYPMAMLPGTHLMGPTPNYYISNMPGGMGVNPAVSYGQTQLPYGHQTYTYMKKKYVRGGKQFVRKDFSNRGPMEGYPNMVYPPDMVATCYPGSMVQAATGVPIMMHQPMPSYMPPGNIHIPPIPVTNQNLIYPTSNLPVCTPDVHPEHIIPVLQTRMEITELPGEPEVKSDVKSEVKSEAKPIYLEVKPETQVEIKPEVRVEIKPEVRVEIKPEVKAEIKAKPKVEIKLEVQPEETLIKFELPAEEIAPAPEPIEKESPLSVAEAAEAPSKSWASLFKKEAEAGPTSEKPTARVEPYTSLVDVKTQSPAKAPEVLSKIDASTQRLAKHLSSYETPFTPLALLPRGLINKSNWCYINATLQALAACPLFVHLMKSLVPLVGAYNKEDSTTPIISSMVEFFHQFDTVPVRSHKDRAAAKKEDPYFGTSFEPSVVYKMLSKTKSGTFKVEGRQEDAEEFLSCLLNGLHDEMIDILKTTDRETVSADQTRAKPTSNDEEDWQVIGPKNKGCVTRTTTYSKTPVSNLFLGLMRSALLYAGAQSTATLQPFFSLQLDIQSDKVYSVRDALSCLVTKEPLTGYVSSKTGQEVEASRQSTLEELPLILILHLKCFVYDKSGGCQKLLKHIEFSSDLDISKDLLSPNQKNKYKERQRQYKLFAVVYHDGKEVNKGHYVTEVHHAGMGSWLRYDDSVINRVSDSLLFKYSLPRMPYLLLYRRADTCSHVINARPVQSNHST